MWRCRASAVAVAAPRVDEQDGPPSRHEFLLVEADIVGYVVPRVVRAAVDVDQQGLRPGGSLRVSHHPCLNGRAVADRERAARTQVEGRTVEPAPVAAEPTVGARERSIPS